MDLLLWMWLVKGPAFSAVGSPLDSVDTTISTLTATTTQPAARLPSSPNVILGSLSTEWSVVQSLTLFQALPLLFSGKRQTHAVLQKHARGAACREGVFFLKETLRYIDRSRHSQNGRIEILSEKISSSALQNTTALQVTEELQDEFDEHEDAGVSAKVERLSVDVENLNTTFVVQRPNSSIRLVTSFGEVFHYSKLYVVPPEYLNVDNVMPQFGEWNYMVISDLIKVF